MQVKDLDELRLNGRIISAGIGRGHICLFDEGQSREVPRYNIPESKTGQEFLRLTAVLGQVKAELDRVIAFVSNDIGKSEAAIFNVHKMILEDAEYLKMIENAVKEKKVNLESAIIDVTAALKDKFSRIPDEYVSERGLDMEDLAGRLLSHLRKCEGRLRCAIHPHESIIIAARRLTSSLAVHLAKNVQGIIAGEGGINSHAAILARARGIPVVVLDPAAVDGFKCGERAVLDANAGTVYLNPLPGTLKKLEGDIAKYNSLKDVFVAENRLEAVTKDGVRIYVSANIEKKEEAGALATFSNDGIGLLRTEFIFMDEISFPELEVQASIYGEIAAGVKGKDVIIRTLDIGGDKNLPYYRLPEEDNPSLGLRGPRLIGSMRGVYKTQLKAIIKAHSKHGNIKILYPMVASLGDVRDYKSIYNEAKMELAAEGHQGAGEDVPQGIMIEVPSILFTLDLVAGEVAFYSVGNNDLLQYTLAVDRNSKHVSTYYDPYHPVHFRMLADIIKNASKEGKEVSVCGEVGGDPYFTGVLAGLGLRRFSCNPLQIPQIRAVVRRISCSEWEKHAAALLKLGSPEEIKRFIHSKIEYGELIYSKEII